LDVIPPYWSPHDLHAYTYGRSFAETRENWVLVQSPLAKDEGRAAGVSPLKSAADEIDRATHAHASVGRGTQAAADIAPATLAQEVN
jgi:hypothetical protein